VSERMSMPLGQLTKVKNVEKRKRGEAKNQKLTQKHFKILTMRQVSSLALCTRQMMRKPIRSTRVLIMKWTSAEKPGG
jgi:hypothetical protein